jgi:hypothetical protein
MTTIEITLRALKLNPPLVSSGHSLLQCQLILPRPGIQSRSALKPVELNKGAVSLRRAPFYAAALLKEKVEGRFALRLQLTRPQRNPAAARALQTMLASVIEATGDSLAAQVPLSTLRPLIRAPFDQLADGFEDDTSDFLLDASIDLNEVDLLSQEVSLPLCLTETLRHNSLPPGPQSREARKTKTKTYKKGLVVGEAVIAIRVE